MCQSPITVANRSRRYTEGVSKTHFSVPCGHCHECQKRMQDDWFVRSFFEFERVRKKGSCWFFTLTYTDDNLPFYTDDDYKECLLDDGVVRSFTRPCFSALHLKRFRDRLRTYLSRAGYDISGIRYFVSCELGGKFGRPHYHPLLFLPFCIPFKQLFDILCKAWPYGRVGFSRKHGMLVKSDRAVQYCCKYVSKDSSWFRHFGLSDYQSKLYIDYKNGVDGAELKLKEFRRCYRLHWQSMCYGVTGVDRCFLSDGLVSSDGIQRFVDDRVNLLNFGLDVDEKLRNTEFAIPNYYKRKVLRAPSVDATEVKTDAAYTVSELRYTSLLRAFKDTYDSYFNLEKFREHVAPLGLSDADVLTRFQSLINCFNYNNCFASPASLSLYSLVYHNLPFSLERDGDFWPNPLIKVSSFELRYTMSPRRCYNLLCGVAKDVFVNSSRYEDPVPQPKNKSRFDVDKNHFRHVLPSYADLPCFKGFSNFVNLVSEYETALGSVVSRSSMSRDYDDYRFALLTNVFADKYSFVYSNMYEL